MNLRLVALSKSGGWFRKIVAFVNGARLALLPPDTLGIVVRNTFGNYSKFIASFILIIGRSPLTELKLQAEYFGKHRRSFHAVVLAHAVSLVLSFAFSTYTAR